MDKRFSWIFLAVSGAFFVFVVGLTGFRIEAARRANVESAQQRLPALRDRAAELRDLSGGFESPQFKADMRPAFDAEPRLLLLSLNAPDDGILYLVSRSRGLLREPAELTPDWRGTPSYRTTRGYQVLLSTTLDGDTGTVTMDAVYSIMGRDDLYPIVRDDLFLFLSFLLVCGVTILIMMSVQEDRSRAAAGAAASVSPAGPGFTSPAPAASPAFETTLSPFAAAVQATPGPIAEHRAAERPRAEPPADTGVDARTASRGLTSPHTGLVWADHLEARLSAELSRASAADQDLACARIRIDEPFADAKLPLVQAEVAGLLKAALPVHDLLFEHGSDGFSVVLPDTDVDTAVRTLEVFRSKTAAALVQGRARTLSVGVSSRGGRLIDARTILEEADTAVAKASREGGNQVIGFRADPSRYRSELAGASA
jgi:GGDEF domain-containing protein